MDANDDEHYRKEAIIFFRSLINFKLSANKSTRPTNFSGHIGRHMDSYQKGLKEWFLNKYPNNSDFVKFFLENDDVFGYDCLSGEVRLNSYANRFEKPKHLSEIESQVKNHNNSLDTISKRMSELEFFLMIYRQFVDRYESNKTIDISFERIFDLFNDQKNEIMVNRIANMSSKCIDINEKLIQYLAENYETIFIIDEQKRNISLRKSVIDIMNKYSNSFDDIVFELFKELIAKFLRCKGGKDVDDLKEMIAQKHYFVTYYLFDRKHVCDEYTLLDFVMSYPKDFVYKRDVNEEGIVKRIINVVNDQKVEHKHTQAVDESLDETHSGAHNVSNTFSTSTPKTNANVDIGLQFAKQVVQKVTQNTNTNNDSNDNDSDDEIYYEDGDEELFVPQRVVVNEVKVEEEIKVKEEVIDEEYVAKGVVTNHRNVGSEVLINCCVCDKDVSNELISYYDYREYALKHKSCLILKMIRSLQEECGKKFDVKTNVAEKEVQTIPNGYEKSSNPYYNY